MTKPHPNQALAEALARQQGWRPKNGVVGCIRDSRGEYWQCGIKGAPYTFRLPTMMSSGCTVIYSRFYDDGVRAEMSRAEDGRWFIRRYVPIRLGWRHGHQSTGWQRARWTGDSPPEAFRVSTRKAARLKLACRRCDAFAEDKAWELAFIDQVVRKVRDVVDRLPPNMLSVGSPLVTHDGRRLVLHWDHERTVAIEPLHAYEDPVKVLFHAFAISTSLAA